MFPIEDTWYWYDIVTYPAQLLLHFICLLFGGHIDSLGNFGKDYFVGILSCCLYASAINFILARLRNLFGIRG